MKTVMLVREAERGALVDLPARLTGWKRLGEVDRLVVHLATADPRAPDVATVYDAAIELFGERRLADVLCGDLLEGHVVEAHGSREVFGKGCDTLPGPGIVPGFSQLSFIRPLPGMSCADVERHWSEHIPLAVAIHVGMTRYVQDRFDEAGKTGAGWFGMAHLHFPDADVLRNGLFRTPEDVAAITEDVAEFVADHATMLAIEHVVKG